MMAGMRAGWILVTVMACSHAAPPAPAAPKGPTACARAADTMVQTMLDRLASKDAPTEQADAFRNLIRERCEQDGWSAEATRCLIAMKTTADAEPCAKLMTDEQQAALVRDEQAQFGGEPAGGAAARDDAVGAPAPAADPAPAVEAAPPAAPAAVSPMPTPKPDARRRKSSKAKGNGLSGDPCGGGE